MAKWYIGQDVVCIKAEPIPNYNIIGPMLELNKVYKIIGIYMRGEDLRLQLEEDRIEPDLGWLAIRFRPAVKPEDELDISVFQKILEKVGMGIGMEEEWGWGWRVEEEMKVGEEAKVE